MDIFSKWLNKKSLMESGFARVRRIMFGDVPDIRTIGIVTAQNPDGQRPWPGNDIEGERENRDQNKSLEQYLRTRNFGPIKVKGKFGVQEDSFLIPNISKEELVQIGRWFSQQSVIWGRKDVDRSNNPFMQFEYIDSETGRTQSLRTVHIGSGDVQGRDDYYTKIGGRKFIIPFFDDPHSRKVPGRQYGTAVDVPATAATPWTADELADKVRKAETFHIPFFDNPSAELIFDSKVNEVTYYANLLPSSPVARQLVEDIRHHTDAVFIEGKLPTYYWHHRGIVRECLWKLNCL